MLPSTEHLAAGRDGCIDATFPAADAAGRGQQAEDREHRHEEQREDRREAVELRREAAERETRLEARLLQTTSITAGAYRIGAAAKDFRSF